VGQGRGGDVPSSTLSRDLGSSRAATARRQPAAKRAWGFVATAAPARASGQREKGVDLVIPGRGRSLVRWPCYLGETAQGLGGVHWQRIISRNDHGWRL